MQSQFGCFISAGSVAEGRPVWIVPAEFVARAADHIARTGQPYLAHRDDEYRITAVARPAGHGRYEIGGTDVRERTVPTWRQLFWHGYADRITREAFRAWFAFDEDEWDSPAEAAAADAMVLDGWRSSSDGHTAASPLAEVELPRLRAESGVPDIGYLYRLEGSPSGAGAVLVASSALALSCFQFWLDEVGAGIRIQVDAWVRR